MYSELLSTVSGSKGFSATIASQQGFNLCQSESYKQKGIDILLIMWTSLVNSQRCSTLLFGVLQFQQTDHFVCKVLNGERCCFPGNTALQNTEALQKWICGLPQTEPITKDTEFWRPVYTQTCEGLPRPVGLFCYKHLTAVFPSLTGRVLQSKRNTVILYIRCGLNW